MACYQHIILALDLYPNADITVAKKAQELARTYGAKLTVVHAVERLNIYGIGQAYPGILDIEGDLLNAAKTELDKICTPLGIATADQVVAVGTPSAIILEAVQTKNADLIIVGSHGRHGLSLLMGSTANAVLHHAACDVLAIRIRDTDQLA